VASEDEWRDRISAATAEAARSVSALTYRRIKFRSFSSPVVIGCDDGHNYVVKALGKRPGLHRALFNDLIMGTLAGFLSAPVPAVALVNLRAELIQAEPDLDGLSSGLAYGSRYMPDASKTRQGIAFTNLPANRPRFALLALFYGLAYVQHDHQFIYQDVTNLVFSFDHGHFFPNGPDWTIQGLAGAPAAVPDPVICQACQFSAAELADARQRLELIGPDQIASAVAASPDTWGVSIPERVQLAMYLMKRKNELAT
jgi:hypothetical protein